MVADKLKALATAKAKVARLEQSIAAERTGELAALPRRYGFDNVAAFVAAVKAAAGKRRGRKPGVVTPVKRRKRAKITDAIRAKVKKLVDADKTAGEIAAATGISEASVANVKKVLGLTKKRG